MNHSAVLLLLSRLEWSRGLSKESRQALASILIRKKLKKKEILFSEGEPGRALFILEQGAIRLHKTSTDGTDVVIRIVKPGQIFAEVVLFERENYPVTALALRESHVLMLPQKGFYSLLAREEFRIDFIRDLFAKHRYLTERIVYLTAHDTEERLWMFLKEHFGPCESMTPSISRKELAAAIGATPETFSRLLFRLKKEGRLTWKGDTICLPKGFWQRLQKQQ